MSAHDGIFNHLVGRSLCPPPRPVEEATGLLSAHRAEVLREAGWVTCSPQWLADHPGECGTAPRVAGGPDISHWHPKFTRAEVLREVDDQLSAMTLPEYLKGTFDAGSYSQAWRNCREVVRRMAAEAGESRG